VLLRWEALAAFEELKLVLLDVVKRRVELRSKAFSLPLIV